MRDAAIHVAAKTLQPGDKPGLAVRDTLGAHQKLSADGADHCDRALRLGVPENGLNLVILPSRIKHLSAGSTVGRHWSGFQCQSFDLLLSALLGGRVSIPDSGCSTSYQTDARTNCRALPDT